MGKRRHGSVPKPKSNGNGKRRRRLKNSEPRTIKLERIRKRRKLKRNVERRRPRKNVKPNRLLTRRPLTLGSRRRSCRTSARRNLWVFLLDRRTLCTLR